MTRRELRHRAEALQTPAAAEDAPLVLMVCTGNICRSPMAEVLLRARLADIPLRVQSAGTRGLIDKPMTPDAQQLAIAHGAAGDHAAAHRARWLTEPVANGADLIIAMAREHRTSAVELAPSKLRQTFTLRELARLTDGLSDEQIREAADAAGADPRARLAALAGLAARQRGTIAPLPLEDDDVIDPYRRSIETYERSTAQLAPAIDVVARVLRTALG
ncbi:low molecular weight phosphatase family protein [Actinomycetales bacterium SN12]|nr:low molecular weight phosphatase family protein [Actinomycetales bacterium SN12]